jgi:glycerol kinase
VSNASRTLLLDLETLDWDDELLSILKIPRKILPKICASSQVFGHTKGIPGLPDGIPIAGIAGDQQAALFGQACFEPGDAKCTYGTGSFLLINTGKKCIHSDKGILTTVAWKIKDEVTYALEGSTFIAGAAIQWLRDGLKLIKSAPEIESLAKEERDSGGVIFVPAFVGLGAPYWKAEARGLITGLSRGTTRGHLARATLEGIAFQIADLIGAMETDFGKKISVLRVDGGACANNLLMQFQADITGHKLVRPQLIETTALGSAFLAGLATGVWLDTHAIQESWKMDQEFLPQMESQEIQDRMALWQKTVTKA